MTVMFSYGLEIIQFQVFEIKIASFNLQFNKLATTESRNTFNLLKHFFVSIWDPITKFPTSESCKLKDGIQIQGQLTSQQRLDIGFLISNSQILVLDFTVKI